MIYSDMVKTALNIAYKAHEGQMDKAGYPYIFHPYHLAEQMHTEDEVVLALLHDVVEDTAVTIKDLRQAGVKENVLEALALLTHAKDVPYADYIAAIKRNKLARAVKLADLMHNCDVTRGGDSPYLAKKRETCYYPAIEAIKKAMEEDEE